jgi:hypothetical protein
MNTLHTEIYFIYYIDISNTLRIREYICKKQLIKKLKIIFILIIIINHKYFKSYEHSPNNYISVKACNKKVHYKIYHYNHNKSQAY